MIIFGVSLCRTARPGAGRVAGVRGESCFPVTAGMLPRPFGGGREVGCRNSHAVVTRIRRRGNPALRRLGDLDRAGLQGASGARHRQCAGRGRLGVADGLNCSGSLPVVLRSDAPAGLDGLSSRVCGIAFSGVDVGCRDRGDAAGRRCVAVEAGCGPLGFGRLRGMASRGEAERLLGVIACAVGSVKPLAEKVP